MRPTDDLAIRARNWFWYWCVRAISGLSNDQLDRKCFGEDGIRRRHFERLQQTASSPNGIALIEGKTLLRIVDRWDAPDGQKGAFALATAAFESTLWQFLANRDASAHIYTDFIQAYVQEKAWARVHVWDSGIYEAFLGPSEPAIEYGVSTAYSAMLHKLVDEATPDALAVLIALFREALHDVLLEQAIAIKPAIEASVSRICKRYDMPDIMFALMYKLVSHRALSNVWFSEADWRDHTNVTRKKAKNSRDRTRNFQAWVNWYVKHSDWLRRKIHGVYPIVPRSPRVDWVARNLDALKVVYAYMSVPDEPFDRDAPLPEIFKLAGVPAKDIQRLVDVFPSPEEPSARFYRVRPARELKELPPAYRLDDTI